MTAGKSTLTAPLLVIFLVVVFDRLSKWQIRSSFVLFESREIIPGFFNLTYLHNNGAAFGFLAGDHGWWRQIFFVVITLAALVFIGAALRHFRHKSVIYSYSLGLIAGGAVGNLIDRLRFGFVVDFLDFYIKGCHWPPFNVADSAICIGVGMFLLVDIRSRKPEDRGRKTDDSE